MPILRCVPVILVALVLASPAAAQTPECNESSAKVLAHQVDPFFLDEPLGQFVCGPFTGPGSIAMAIAARAPTCLPVQNWGVFAFENGAWRKVFERSDYVSDPIEAVGGDLRVTTSVQRDPNEPRCFPMGGTQARIWHWNGSTFVAGAPVQVKPPEPRTGAIFHTPRALGTECWLGDSSDYVGITCQSVRIRPKLYQQKITMGANGRAKICRDRGNRNRCNLGNDGEDPVPTYKYGTDLTIGRFRCRVLKSGVRCVVTATGKGFVISRDRAARI